MVTRARGPARRGRPSCSPSCPPLRPASSSPSSHSLRPEWRPAPLPASFPGGLIEPWAAWTDTRRQERPSKGAPLPGPGALAACFPLAFFFFLFFLYFFVETTSQQLLEFEKQFQTHLRPTTIHILQTMRVYYVPVTFLNDINAMITLAHSLSIRSTSWRG